MDDMRQGEAFEADTSEEPTREEVAAKMRAVLEGLAAKLDAEAQRRVARKQVIENRWLKNLRQYHGQYEPAVLKDLSDANKSTAFLNQTRPKTDAMAARLSDLLFPTDDRNWGVKPTPVPELAREAKSAAEEAARAIAMARAEADQAMAAGASPEQAAELPAVQQATEAANMAVDRTTALRLEMEEAKKRAEAMEDQIADQLTECRYANAARDAIEDACKLGTGIIKGPITSKPRRGKWRNAGDGYAMEDHQGPRPILYRVDPWSFFPDPDSRTIEESESEFERHLMKPTEIRRLAREPGFDKDAIRRVLKDKGRGVLPNYLSELRQISDDAASMVGDVYEVWEWHGSLDAEEIRTIAIAMGKVQMIADMLGDDAEVDPLDEMPVVIWFCQNEVLKFGIHPLDSGEKLYSVFNLSRDDASIFGYGIPHIMEHSQSSLNAAWRMILDNGGISSGPQIVVNTDVIDPTDGSWSLYPRKIWKRKSGTIAGTPAFEVYNIDSHLAELAAIVEMTIKFIDQETAMPEIAQGEQGAQTTQTLGGMSILMNSANVVFRRIVKAWDDDVTVPVIRRTYDWNMQHAEAEEVKGDFEVDARGSSVLLVREMQAATMMAWMTQLGAHPVFAPLLKPRNMAEIAAKTSMLPVDEILKSEAEIEQEAAEAAANPDPMAQAQLLAEENRARELELKEQELSAKVAIAEMESDSRVKVAEMNRDVALQNLAQKGNMELDKIEATEQSKERDRQANERKFAAELAVSEARGPSGGGHF